MALDPDGKRRSSPATPPRARPRASRSLGGPDLTYNGGTVDGFVATAQRVRDRAPLLRLHRRLGHGPRLEGRPGLLGQRLRRRSHDARPRPRSRSPRAPTTPPPTAARTGTSPRSPRTAPRSPSATYLGGPGLDSMGGLAVDSSGNAYVTGSTDSSSFPTTTGPAHGSPGTADAFVAKLNATGSALVYSRFLGGAGVDFGQGIAVDAVRQRLRHGPDPVGQLPANHPADLHRRLRRLRHQGQRCGQRARLQRLHRGLPSRTRASRSPWTTSATPTSRVGRVERVPGIPGDRRTGLHLQRRALTRTPSWRR